MNIDTRINNSFFLHPKTKKLEYALGESAPMYVIKIWVWASLFFPDGVLKNIDDVFLENEIGWTKYHKENLIQILVDLEFLERDGSNLIIHDWQDHNSWASTSNSRNDKGRFSRLKQVAMPAYEYLQSIGITGISKENYQQITTSDNPFEEAKRLFKKYQKRDKTQKSDNPDINSGQPQGNPTGNPKKNERATPGVVFGSNTNTNTNLKKDINNLSHTKNSDTTMRVNPHKSDAEYEREIQKGNFEPDDLPSIEFVELRDFYDRIARPEGSHAGWIEFKRIKKSSAYFPGIHFLMDDISKRIDGGFWDKGFEPGLAKYLLDRTWEQEVTSRQRDKPKTFEELSEERDRKRKENTLQRLKAIQEGSNNGL